MRIHILGICGTFMAGIAVLAKQQGHEVSGCDENVYPPMSTQLENQGITLQQGYDAAHLDSQPDVVIVGNTMSRGDAIVERILNEKIPYISGPQWLAENILQDRWVVAVAGTHGKTTTTSMVTWILEAAGLNPGFLIGGVPENFGVSSRLGEKYFVIEADEYDTAFFDKRPKFIHYHPRTAILNNLEFDHADIYANLDAIALQFHYFVRTIPGNGLVVYPEHESTLKEVLQKGCWTAAQSFALSSDTMSEWYAVSDLPDGSQFSVYHKGKRVAEVSWSLLGQHNVCNALSAIIAASDVGVAPEVSAKALSKFKNVKRRLELKGEVGGVKVYDDFAHHPTAIQTTLLGLRQHVKNDRIIAVLESGSYTLRTGILKEQLIPAFSRADHVYFARPSDENWGLSEIAKRLACPAQVETSVDKIVKEIEKIVRPGDHILVMSKSAFDSIHKKLLTMLKEKLDEPALA